MADWDIFFRSTADLGDDQLYPEELTVSSELSSPFAATLRVRHEVEGGLTDELLDSILARPVVAGPAGHPDQAVFGIVEAIEAEAVSGPRPSSYRLALRPKLWLLSLTRRSRVFQDMTHVEVALAVLAEHGFEVGAHVRDETEADYPTAEYVVQYRETDLDFVRRLLAHQGVHFHFVAEGGTDVVVLGDRNGVFRAVEGEETLTHAAYAGVGGALAPVVHGLRRKRRRVPRNVILRDYNWRVPHHPLTVPETVDEVTGYGYLEHYGEHFSDDAEGSRLAALRAEEARVERDVCAGFTSFPGLRPGRTFTLEAHPHEEMNRRYLVIRAEEAFRGGAYENRFEAIPADSPYRPVRAIPWPRIEGLLHGIVDGEARSTATPIDDEGRYRVVLPIDEAARPGGRASRWVRRAQPSAGAAYGMHFPLHIGTEVTIAHVNGDPDRPIILGAVPNAATPSPVRAGNAPQSRIATGSGAVIELDDDC